jgi:CPA2 family monovalent cation:H+ antiporter-2
MRGLVPTPRNGRDRKCGFLRIGYKSTDNLDPGIIEVFARYHKAVVVLTITGTCQGATGYPCSDSVVLWCYTLPVFFEHGEGGRMTAHSLIFRDIAMVLAAALLCGLLAWRLRQPILLGYVLAGLLLSPLTPGPHVQDVHTFEILAEIGVILLMFSVGIEFSIPDLLRVKWVALAGAPLGILLSIGLGAGIGALIGWPWTQGIAVGCIVSVASTMVLMRHLMDRGELASDAGRVMITLTLVEDLAVVILTVALPGLSPSRAEDFPHVAFKIGKSLLLLIPIAVAAWKLVPPLLSRVERTCNDEISLLLALTICMAIAALTEAAGLSLALGAFLAGLFLGNTTFHSQAGATDSLSP